MIATHPCYDSGNRWPARPHLIVSASRLLAGPRPSRLLSCRKRNIKRRWVRFNFNLKNTLFASASVNLHPDPPFSSEHLRRRGCAWAGYFCSDRSDLSLSTKTDVMSETLIRAWHMSDDECEHYGHWMVYIINATLNDPFKSVLGNNQSKCRKYRIREWFLTNFAE